MKEMIAKAGDIIIGRDDEVITARALGSSLGICLYDAKYHIGGMITCLLPSNIKQDRKSSCYIDTGICMLYQQVQDASTDELNLEAKLVGGANLFLSGQGFVEEDIGRQNIKAAYVMLEKLHVKITATDIGDTFGRTIHFHLSDGSIYIETKHTYIYHI